MLTSGGLWYCVHGLINIKSFWEDDIHLLPLLRAVKPMMKPHQQDFGILAAETVQSSD